MKKLLVLCLLTSFSFACSFNEKIKLENSIGKLITSHSEKFSYQSNLNPFGTAIIYDEFSNIYYSDIQKLETNLRIQYFWAAMWHLDFDGHSMEQFQMLVFKDCGNEFIKKLAEYVTKETELGRDKSRLYLSNQVLLGMKRLDKSH